MRHVIEAGTDAGMLVLFDPAALPETYDSLKDGGIEVLEGLDKEGKLFLAHLGGDGGYLLHAYIDEDVPAHLSTYAKDPKAFPAFPIQSGRLYFTGIEYAFHADDSKLKKYDHMGGHAEVEAGNWDLTLYRTEYPDDDNSYMTQGPDLTAGERRILGLFNFFAWFLIPAVIYGIATMFMMPWSAWFVFGLPVPLGLCLVLYLIGRIPLHRQASKKLDEKEREYPSMIAVLKKGNE